MEANRRSRVKHRSCWIAFIVLLALPAVTAVLLAAHARFCATPTEQSLSQGLVQSVLLSESSEAEIIQHIYDELSWKVSSYGTGMLGWVFYEDTCQGDNCDYAYLHMEMIVKIFDLCMFLRRVGYTTVTTTIDVNESTVEIKVLQGTMWPWPIAIKTTERDISLEVSRVRERAVESLADVLREANSSVLLKFSRNSDSWTVSAYTPREELIHSVKVHLSDYRVTEEDMQ